MNMINNYDLELPKKEKIYSGLEPETIFRSSKPRRTQICSLGDILSVIKEGGRDGIIISIISRRANLSHNVALQKCSKLSSAGLIEEKILEQRKAFHITEKGLDFLNEFEKFQILVKPFNLKF